MASMIFILSTVVMMFPGSQNNPSVLSPTCSAALSPGGYNLIVAAMDTEDYPCTVGFPFAFKPEELRDYYAGWQFLKYNEDVGELHRTDASGNRIKLRFATMLARKPANQPPAGTAAGRLDRRPQRRAAAKIRISNGNYARR